MCHRWWRRGERAPGTRQIGYQWAYIFSAVRPDTGDDVTLVMPSVNAKVMDLFLAHFADTLDQDAHAVMMCDGAGWHDERALKGNDKGKVEGIVGYCRRNFLAPMPRFRNFDDLNTHLEACCAKRWAEQLRGHDQTVGERLERDRAVLQRLPAIAYDACDKRPGRVSSLSLVRYRGTDYSVPTRFGHCEVLVRGYVHEVVISCAAEVIARHPRSYEQEDFVFDPLHYLSLLEQKTNALDQAAPLAGWLLPPVFGDLRRLLEARMGKAGKREYVQVLRLIESFSLDDVRAAISEALERGVIGFDAVKHLVLCRIEKRPPRLNLLAHPYLPRAEVATTSARSYMGLLKGAAP